MNKKIIITVSIFSLISLIVGLGIYFYIQDQNKKLTLSYLINQCKEEGEYDETADTNDDYPIKYKGIKYVCDKKDYNQIVKFKEDEKSSQETYAFRVDTAEPAGNSGNKFNYEIARIVIDTVNPSISKCTYNYRGKADWKPCNEKKLIQTLPEISLLKSTAYKPLKILLLDINEREINSYYGSGKDTQYNSDKLEENYEKFEKQLEILRNTTLLK